MQQKLTPQAKRIKWQQQHLRPLKKDDVKYDDGLNWLKAYTLQETSRKGVGWLVLRDYTQNGEQRKL